MKAVPFVALPSAFEVVKAMVGAGRQRRSGDLSGIPRCEFRDGLPNCLAALRTPLRRANQAPPIGHEAVWRTRSALRHADYIELS